MIRTKIVPSKHQVPSGAEAY